MLGAIRDAFGIDFMRNALLAGLLVGGICGYLGLYVVLKRIAFVGIALAELSSAGIALALWVAGVFDVEATGTLTMAGALGLMLLGVLLFSVRGSGRRIPQESAIGVGYAIAAAGGLLLMAHSAKGEAHLMELMFGNILYVSPREIWEFALAALLVAVIHTLFAKEFLFVSFDPEMAGAMGYRVRLWELLLYLSLGLTIAFAIRVVGVLLAFSLLVMPAVTALLLTRRLHSAVPTAIVCGMFPIGIGLYLSFARDLPSAATIVLTSFLLMLAAGGISLLRRA